MLQKQIGHSIVTKLSCLRVAGNRELMQIHLQKFKNEKETANQIVADYLSAHLGSADPEVLRAFNEVPREYFQYQYQDNYSFANVAYEDKPEKVKPWAIGWGSALSDYLGQTYMTQIAKPTSSDTVLEVGTGSGYQSALLSYCKKSIFNRNNKTIR